MILIVDDMPEIVQWLSKVAEEAGYYADFSMDGVSALYKLKRIYYPLALIDIMLPHGMDGNELARQVKALPEPFCKTPLVAMTGGLGDAVHPDLFIHTIRKPFLPRHFRDVIQQFARPPIKDLHVAVQTAADIDSIVGKAP